ncbi:formate dehydrogenase subunit alpha [Terriglobus albidus]|uniref:formate dehydrogenase subunit alpha n=1 Tax=Terriglobus albidus TaxID=1592106 RepID=UPI0021DFB395|nr:formate dehydrogenase subunit alpha [Terriglobus albidus]
MPAKRLLNTEAVLPLDTTIQLDGAPVLAATGELLVERINHALPDRKLAQVCYHHSMGPIETCDTCLVEVNGKLVRACATPVTPGMEVATRSQRADAAQRDAFDRILHNHDLYCTVCDNSNHNCTVHNTAMNLDVKHQVREFEHKPYPQDHSNPFYRYDPSQCILCGRCVEACQNVQVNETLTINWESEHPRVLWDGGTQIAGSSCVSCGHCVTVCPCNALMEKSMLGRAGYLTALPQPVLNGMIAAVKAVEPATGFPPIMAISNGEAAARELRNKRTKTVCTYCGVGCSFDVWTQGRHILKIEPADGPANGISTCVKGKFGWDFVNSKERIRHPMVRDEKTNELRKTTWKEALDLIEQRFKQIKQNHGPDAFAFIASSKCTNEESYLMQKLARQVIGTNNIDNCSRYCQTPATMGLSRTVGYGGDAGSIADIEQAELVIIVGSNTCESHPVLATRIKRSQKHRGQKVIVADLRRHEMAERADLFLHPKPSTDPIWINAVANYILQQGWHKQEFIDRWVDNFDAQRESLAQYTLEFAEQRTGIAQETLIQVANWIAQSKTVCILWAMGVTQHCGGSDTSTAISNLLLLTGNYMRPATGAYPLRGHNNVQGASDFGSMPNVYSGYQKVADEQVRAKFEAAWQCTLPTKDGLDNHEMIRAIHDGTLKCLYLKGEDTITSDANANDVKVALEQVEFLVVQDISLSETAKFADVVLPASPSLEKEGTFTNTERRIQRLYRAIKPLGFSKPDWEIIQLIANRMGGKWKYKHPSEVMDEVAALTPLFAGVSYERLEGYKSLQWPVAKDGTDSPYLFKDGFPFPDGKARFHPVNWVEPSEEQRDGEFTLHLNNGRLLEHFEQGAMTYQSEGIRALTPTNFVEVSPELAAEHGLSDGTLVELRSPYGNARVPVVVTSRVQGRELYMPLNSVDQPVNRLTGAHVDRATHTPAYKELSVSLTKLGEQRPNPLPPGNFRHGHRTPQPGVEVERKWARPDYTLPGSTLVQIKTTTV